MSGGDEQAALDAAVDEYERALDLRDAGDHVAALVIVEKALASIEELYSHGAAVARARFAITRADLATRTRSLSEAIAAATDAVTRAQRVARNEPLVEASALYMLGKAERPSAEHRYGAASFERSFALWRKHEGDASRYTTDAAGALGTAYVKLADWTRAKTAIDHVITHDPDGADLVHRLHRAIACERLGELEAAAHDLETWLVDAKTRSREEQLRGHLCTARVIAQRNPTRAASELARACELVNELLASEPGPPKGGGEAPGIDDARRASLLEGFAWNFAIATPAWPLAAEVLIRRAAALAWSPAIADTAWRIAALWRYGVEEDFVQPTFAVLDVEACLQVWDATAWKYGTRPGSQRVQFVVAGAPTTLERLADDRWRDLCVQRVFSTFHAEQFKAHEPSFVAPVTSKARLLGAPDALALLRLLRKPKWVTGTTIALTSLGEIEVIPELDLAAHAVRSLALGDETAQTMLVEAVPTLDRDAARVFLAEPPGATIAPSSSIPLIPGS